MMTLERHYLENARSASTDNAQWSDFLFLATPQNRPWKKAKDLLDAIKANPGKYSMGVDFGSTGHFATLILMQAMGLQPSAVRIVTFDGGGQLRSAIAGGQVDVSILQAEGSDTMKDLIRPLAVILDKPSPLFDAPPINDVLKSSNITTIPLLSGSIRALSVSTRFRLKHSPDFDRLVDAYKRTIENPQFQSWLKGNKMIGEWLGPEASTEKIKVNFEVLKKYQLLDSFAGVIGSSSMTEH
jgi:putative tricarboxylic transport membrane protein